MSKIAYLFIVFAVFQTAKCDSADVTPSTQAPYPIYKATYVPHRTYHDMSPDSDTYPFYPSYETSALTTAAKGTFAIILSGLSKTGLFLLGGILLLVVGGLFTAAVCSYTPYCTLTFNGAGPISKDTMRAFMTPEKLATAAALVQDAVGKYQRLQKMTN